MGVVPGHICTLTGGLRIITESNTYQPASKYNPREIANSQLRIRLMRVTAPGFPSEQKISQGTHIESQRANRMVTSWDFFGKLSHL